MQIVFILFDSEPLELGKRGAISTSIRLFILADADLNPSTSHELKERKVIGSRGDPVFIRVHHHRIRRRRLRVRPYRVLLPLRLLLPSQLLNCSFGNRKSSKQAPVLRLEFSDLAVLARQLPPKTCNLRHS